MVDTGRPDSAVERIRARVQEKADRRAALRGADAPAVHPPTPRAAGTPSATPPGRD
ncbi:MAG: hypothetical protein JWR66_2088, partial [Modestobacter sp.]|nr:hypothetical protein [Modestobacter sp.]